MSTEQNSSHTSSQYYEVTDMKHQEHLWACPEETVSVNISDTYIGTVYNNQIKQIYNSKKIPHKWHRNSSFLLLSVDAGYLTYWTVYN